MNTATILPTLSRVTLVYNGDNTRVEKDLSGSTRRYVLDGQNIVLETDGTNLTQAVYTLEPQDYGKLLSQRQNQSGTWVPIHYSFDGLGSTDSLSDSNQVITDTYTYFAFGLLKASSGSTTNCFAWVGELGYIRDTETGEYDLRARQYLPDRARFKSQDPLGLSADPNAFRYVTANPLNRLDPAGLQQLPTPSTQSATGVTSGPLNPPPAFTTFRGECKCSCTRLSDLAAPPTVQSEWVLAASTADFMAQCNQFCMESSNSDTTCTALSLPLGIAIPCVATYNGQYYFGDDLTVANSLNEDKRKAVYAVAQERGYVSDELIKLAVIALLTLLLIAELYILSLAIGGAAGAAAASGLTLGLSLGIAVVFGAQLLQIYYKWLALDNLVASAMNCSDIDEAAHVYAEEVVLVAAVVVEIMTLAASYGWATGGVTFQPAAWPAIGGSPSVGPVAVIGRRPDTMVAVDWPGHDVLNLPDDLWSIEANDAWIAQQIAQKKWIYLASPVTKANLYNPEGKLTIFGREVALLLEAGYRIVGDMLVPPN